MKLETFVLRALTDVRDGKSTVMEAYAALSDRLSDEFDEASASHVNPLGWEVQVKGAKGDESWEISVIRLDNQHGHDSWGWFDDTKLLVSHNGGPCNWPVIGFVWDEQIRIANALCDGLNDGTIQPPTS